MKSNEATELSTTFFCDWEASVLLKSRGAPYGIHRDQESMLEK